MTRWIGALIAAVGLGATLVAQSGSPSPAGFSIDFIDRSADVCTDFYQFACGNWMKQHPLPADRSRYGRMQQLADRNDEIVRTILERASLRTSERTPDEQRLGDYFASCMDERTIDARGSAPLMPLLRDIDRLESLADLVRMAGRFSRMGLPGLLNLGSAPDARDASMLIATLGQPTLGLPDRDLYLRDDARSSGLRAEYLAHVQRMFELLGDTATQAAQAARAVAKPWRPGLHPLAPSAQDQAAQKIRAAVEPHFPYGARVPASVFRATCRLKIPTTACPA